MDGDMLAGTGQGILHLGSKTLAGLQAKDRQKGLLGKSPERQCAAAEAGERLVPLRGFECDGEAID